MRPKPSYLRNQDVIRLIEDQARIAGPNKLRFDPGAQYDYINTGYVILAEIIRKLTGTSLREFLKKEIFDPLKMRDTFVYDETVEEFSDHSLCYNRLKEKYVSIESDTQYNSIHGDGNVHSTIEDLMKWQIACNRIDDSESVSASRVPLLIEKSTFLAVFDPLSNKPLSYRARDVDYAAGFNIYRVENENGNAFALHHTGSWLGFNSYLVRAQVQFDHDGTTEQKRISIVVLPNNAQLSFDSAINPFTIAQDLARLYWESLGLPARYEVLQYLK